MKKKLFILTFLTLLMCLWVSFSLGQSPSKKKIIIEAKVVKVGTPPKIRSGTRRHVYQLVKYEVLKVLNGELNEKYIVVDHLIIFDDNVVNFQEGDTVILEIFPRKNISTITFEKGIREEDDKNKIETYYIQGKIVRKSKDG